MSLNFILLNCFKIISSFTFSDNLVNHISATNPLDGTTCLHKTVEGSDNVDLAAGLLSMVANIQDSFGLTSLHLACKLNRRKIVELLIVSVHFAFDIRLSLSSPRQKVNFYVKYNCNNQNRTNHKIACWSCFTRDFTVLVNAVTQYFQRYPFVDLNVQTKDGRLPEEMTSRRSIQ